VSSRQELYPHNMEALRALKLGIGALSGLGLDEKNEGFTIWQVHNRVSSRYPEAMALPTDPKELELMLQKVGIDVRWEADSEVFRRRKLRLWSFRGLRLAAGEARVNQGTRQGRRRVHRGDRMLLARRSARGLEDVGRCSRDA